MQGDEEGKKTFIGKKGNSVIDFAICNDEAWNEIHKMKIGDRTESNHRPIEITLERQIERKKNKDKWEEIED